MTRATRSFAPLLLLALALAACGAEGRRAPTPVASTSGSADGPIASASAETPTPPSGPRRAPYDASRITPRIDAPALAAAEPLVAARKWRDAAAEVDLVAKVSTGEDAAALYYLEATYKLRAGDPKGAAVAFETAAKTGGPLASYAWLNAAQRRSDLGEHEAVLSALAGVDAALVPRAKTDLLRAKALIRTGKAEDGFAVYREILVRHEKSWATTALELGRALLDHPAGAHGDEAARLALDVSLDGPASREAEAKKLLSDALATMRVEDRKPFDEPSDEELAKRGARLVASGRGKQALAIATKLEKRKDESCGSVSLRARALMAVGRASEASTTFEAALTACSGLAPTEGAKLLWDAGRAAAKGGNLKKAIARFAALEEQFHDSTLADDARIERAKAALDDSDDAAFVGALATIATDYPKGDVTADGVYLLAMTLAKRGDWEQAIPVLRTGSALEKERSYYRAGRFDYFLGRALAVMEDKLTALKSYGVVLERYPIGYYAALACARADELEAGFCKKALGPEGRTQPADPAAPDDATRASGPFVAAELLASLDDAPMVNVALDALGVGDRTAAPEVTLAGALMLARTTHPAASHLLLRSATESAPRTERREVFAYLDASANGAWRATWEAAFPRPFAKAVTKASSESNVPEALIYAIMREESALDPNAVSSAGALGLTQIMPFTAKRGAKALGLPEEDAAYLEPEENIRIGAHFLKQMRTRFADNPLLAIPAYNAGPLAPEGWTKDRPGMAFDLFVEDIPYTETRNYTKRVIGSLFAYEVLMGTVETGEAAHTPVLARKP